MDIGTNVKIDIPYKLGEKKHGERYKYGKVVGKYPNFYLVEITRNGKGIYKEAYREEELIIDKR